MKVQAILSVLGPDRVGVASDLAKALERLGLHTETSRATRLRKRFSILMAISGEQSNVADLRRKLPSLRAELGFDLQLGPDEVVEPEETATTAPGRGGREMLIESFSGEPMGLNCITEVLKRRRVDIEELVTDVSAASCTSPKTFSMQARVVVPEFCSVDQLREELRELKRGRDLHIEIKRGHGTRGSRVPEEVF